MMDQLIDDAVIKRFLRREIMIAFDIFANSFAILSGASVKKLNLSVSKALTLSRLNFEAGDITFRFPDCLVKHQGRKLIR